MIGAPPGWQAFRGVRELCFVHPLGADHGIITYDEGHRPLAPIPQLVAAVLRARAAFTPGAGEIEIERLVTGEGEHAARARVEGAAGGRPAQLDLGFVLFDDHYSRIVGASAVPAMAAEITALVRQLVVGDTYLLGSRPRRPHYARPEGWHGIARGLLTEWYPPAYPRDAAVLTVWPALPRDRRRPPWQRAAFQLDRGFAIDERRTRRIHTAPGLSGHAFHLARAQVERVVVVLEDATYVYLVRLDLARIIHGATEPRELSGLEASAERAAAHRDALAELVNSCRPIPGRSAALPPSAHDHWV
jgi:hypothetical protein